MTLKELLIAAALVGALGWFLWMLFRNAMRHMSLPREKKVAVFALALLAIGLLVWLAVALGVNPRVFQPRF